MCNWRQQSFHYQRPVTLFSINVLSLTPQQLYIYICEKNIINQSVNLWGNEVLTYLESKFLTKCNCLNRVLNSLNRIRTKITLLCSPFHKLHFNPCLTRRVPIETSIPKNTFPVTLPSTSSTETLEGRVVHLMAELSLRVKKTFQTIF